MCKLCFCIKSKNLRWLNEQVKRLLNFNTPAVSPNMDFQVWLQCWCYHYYLLVWCCLGNCDVRHLCGFIASHWNKKHCKKARFLPNTHVQKFFPNVHCPLILGQFAKRFVETAWRQKISTPGISRNSSTLLSGCYVCYHFLYLFFRPGLNFFGKIYLIWLSWDFVVLPNFKKQQNFEIFITTCLYMTLSIYLL